MTDTHMPFSGGVCRATFDKRCIAKWCPIASRASAAATVQAAVDRAADRSSPHAFPGLSESGVNLNQPPIPPWDPTPSRPGDLPRVPSRQESLDSDMPEELELSETGRPGVLSYVAGALQNGVQDSTQIGVGAFKSLLRTFQKGSNAAPAASAVSVTTSPDAADSLPASPSEQLESETSHSPSHMLRSQHGTADHNHALEATGQAAATQRDMPTVQSRFSAYANDGAQSGEGIADELTGNPSISQNTGHTGSGSLGEAVLQDVKAYGNAIGVAPPNATPPAASRDTASTSDTGPWQSSIGRGSQASAHSVQHQSLPQNLRSGEEHHNGGQPIGTVLQGSESGQLEAPQFEPGTSAANAVGQEVDGSLERALAGRPVASIPDEALCSVADAAVKATGTSACSV